MTIFHSRAHCTLYHTERMVVSRVIAVLFFSHGTLSFDGSKSFDGLKYSFAFLGLLPTSSSLSLKTSAMGLGFDSTVIPAHHTWLAYLHEAQRYLPDSRYRLALLVFINVPVMVVILNVLRQLVRLKTSSRIHNADVVPHRSFPETRHCPPRSSILYPSLDLQQAMGMTQLHSSIPAAKRCVWLCANKHKTP